MSVHIIILRGMIYYSALFIWLQYLNQISGILLFKAVKIIEFARLNNLTNNFRKHVMQNIQLLPNESLQ